MRWWLVGLALSLAACEAAQVVDCSSSGELARAGGDHFCVYPRGATVECPRLLPVEHALPWGGYGCASREHDPLPPDLCVALGRCAADGGAP